MRRLAAACASAFVGGALVAGRRSEASGFSGGGATPAAEAARAAAPSTAGFRVGFSDFSVPHSYFGGGRGAEPPYGRRSPADGRRSLAAADAASPAPTPAERRSFRLGPVTPSTAAAGAASDVAPQSFGASGSVYGVDAAPGDDPSVRSHDSAVGVEAVAGAPAAPGSEGGFGSGPDGAAGGARVPVLVPVTDGGSFGENSTGAKAGFSALAEQAVAAVGGKTSAKSFLEGGRGTVSDDPLAGSADSGASGLFENSSLFLSRISRLGLPRKGRLLMMPPPLFESHLSVYKLLGKQLRASFGHELTLILGDKRSIDLDAEDYRVLQFKGLFSTEEGAATLSEKLRQILDGKLTMLQLFDILGLYLANCDLFWSDPTDAIGRLRAGGPYDLVLVDSNDLCGFLIASDLHLPVMVLSIGMWVPYEAMLPTPLSYVPEFNSLQTDRMSFAQRVANSLTYLISRFGVKTFVYPLYDSLIRKYEIGPAYRPAGDSPAGGAESAAAGLADATPLTAAEAATGPKAAAAAAAAAAGDTGSQLAAAVSAAEGVAANGAAAAASAALLAAPLGAPGSAQRLLDLDRQRAREAVGARGSVGRPSKLRAASRRELPSDVQAGFLRFANMGPEPRFMGDMIWSTNAWLVATEAALEFPRPSMPHVSFVGGLLTQPARPLPSELRRWADAQTSGFIVASMGSSVSVLDPRLEKVFVDAFARVGLPVIWRYSRRIESLAPNILLADWIPQNDLLGHPNVLLFVGHGGTNGVYECLFHGVPIVGMPLFGDHVDTMVRVVAKGIGVSIDHRTLTADKLFAAINKVLQNPEYRLAMRVLSRVHKDRRDHPLVEAAVAVDRVVRYEGAEHLKPAVNDLTFAQFWLVDQVAFLILLVVTVNLFCTWLVSHEARKGGAKSGSSVGQSSFKEPAKAAAVAAAGGNGGLFVSGPRVLQYAPTGGGMHEVRHEGASSGAAGGFASPWKKAAAAATAAAATVAAAGAAASPTGYMTPSAALSRLRRHDEAAIAGTQLTSQTQPPSPSPPTPVAPSHPASLISFPREVSPP